VALPSLDQPGADPTIAEFTTLTLAV
jgi:hypothetical protein